MRHELDLARLENNEYLKQVDIAKSMERKAGRTPASSDAIGDGGNKEQVAAAVHRVFRQVKAIEGSDELLPLPLVVKLPGQGGKKKKTKRSKAMADNELLEKVAIILLSLFSSACSDPEFVSSFFLATRVQIFQAPPKKRRKEASE